MKFYFNDNKRPIQGRSYLDIVKSLKYSHAGWQDSKTIDEYIKEFADRARSVAGLKLETRSPKQFVRSLLDNNILVTSRDSSIRED